MSEEEQDWGSPASSFGLGFIGLIVFWVSLAVLVWVFLTDPTSIVIADNAAWALSDRLIATVGADGLYTYVAMIWTIKLSFTGVWIGPVLIGLGAIERAVRDLQPRA